jgi:hypothetical protein
MHIDCEMNGQIELLSEMFSRHRKQCKGSKLMRQLCSLFLLVYIKNFKILNQLANFDTKMGVNIMPLDGAKTT